jgi:hypothetical protein
MGDSLTKEPEGCQTAMRTLEGVVAREAPAKSVSADITAVPNVHATLTMMIGQVKINAVFQQPGASVDCPNFTAIKFATVAFGVSWL